MQCGPYKAVQRVMHSDYVNESLVSAISKVYRDIASLRCTFGLSTTSFYTKCKSVPHYTLDIGECIIRLRLTAVLVVGLVNGLAQFFSSKIEVGLLLPCRVRCFVMLTTYVYGVRTKLLLYSVTSPKYCCSLSVDCRRRC